MRSKPHWVAGVNSESFVEAGFVLCRRDGAILARRVRIGGGHLPQKPWTGFVGPNLGPRDKAPLFGS